MIDENLFVFMSDSKSKQIAELEKIESSEFLEKLKKLVGIGPFRFEIIGLNRKEVLKCFQYVYGHIEEYYDDAGWVKELTKIVTLVEGNKQNMLSIEINTSDYSTFEKKKENELEMGTSFCLELMVQDPENNTSEWIVYDRHYNKLFRVKLDMIGVTDIYILEHNLMAACLPKNHF